MPPHSPPGSSSESSPRFSRSACAMNSTLPPSMMSVPRPAMLVATVTAPLRAGHRHNRRLSGVVLGVEHLVLDALRGQQLAQVLGLLHAGGAHQHGLTLLMPLDDVLDDGIELRLLGAVDAVGLVSTNHRPVRGDRHHTQVVGVHELGGLGLGGAGHARELLVELEVVLEGDRGESLVLRLDLHPLLGLDRLVHALVVAAPGQDTTGVLIDDHHLAVEDHVVLVALEQLLRLDGVVEETDQRACSGTRRGCRCPGGPRPCRYRPRARRRCASSRRPRSRGPCAGAPRPSRTR